MNGSLRQDKSYVEKWRDRDRAKEKQHLESKGLFFPSSLGENPSEDGRQDRVRGREREAI